MAEGHVPIAHAASDERVVERFAKRLLDIAVSVVALVLLVPLVLLIGLVIWLDSRGPVFFNSIRVGQNGRQFVMYKFRTMVVDAEEQLSKLQHRNLGGNLLIKIPNDPRITHVGRLLRESSLDELPQLLNVLKGEMSLVGPRPQYPREVAHYTEQQTRRLVVPPGMTGLWQVSARDSASFEDWVRYDLEYIDNWSLWLDIKVLVLTAVAVLRGFAG